MHLSLRIAAASVLLAGSALAAPQKALTSHVPDAVTTHLAALAGRPDPTRLLRLAVALPMRNQPAMDVALADIYNPRSPNYRHYLTVAQFAERFGPAEADYNRVVDFLRAQGLTITGTSANHYIVDVAGRVADVERVFNLRLGLYQHPTEHRLFIAPDREPSLDLGVSILHVTGLDNFELPHNRLHHANVTGARATGSGPGGQFLGSDVRAAYAHGTALTGAGQNIGLMELEGYNVSDVDTYFTKFGPKLTATITGISTDGSPLACTSAGGCTDDSEQALDIEYAISVAPGISTMYVYVANSPESVLNRMASDNTAKQLSTSWGWNTNVATDQPLFKEIAMQGQTLLTASGDYSSLKASGPWPEEDAFIIAVGGTDLATHGAGGAWASETGWSGSAGGPSLSKLTKIQSYQLPFVQTLAGASKTLRNVPDIAADANEDNYICADGSCTGGYGGTSFASPIWAGFIALANQQAAAHGDPAVGFLNPTLYALAGGSTYHSIFHDEVKGRSGKYTAVAGYDLVTGLGSPNGQALINALAP